MQELNLEEIEQVNGGISFKAAATVTLALMAFAAASPIVIGVGCAAIVGHAFLAK